MEVIKESYYRGLATLTAYTLSLHQLMMLLGIGLFITSLLFSNTALAGTVGDDEFSSLYDKLKSLVEGNIKKILVIAAILVGIIGAIAAKSMSFVVICFGFAITLNFIFDIGEQLSGALI